MTVQLTGSSMSFRMLFTWYLVATACGLLVGGADKMPQAHGTMHYAAAEYSHHPCGIYSYIAFDEDEWRLICIRLGMEGTKTLFSVPVPASMKAPVSFEDCVVTVNATGDLRVYDLSGRETLQWVVPSIQGAISQVLRFGYEGRQILFVHRFFGQQNRVQKTELVVVELVTNAKAVVRKRVVLERPSVVRYVATLPRSRGVEVLVVGDDQSVRMPIEIEAPTSHEANSP